jgi:hypothetical protein
VALNDALRGYAHPVLHRDRFRCTYCGLDGTATLDKWLHLSWDHLLPKGHPDRDDHRYIVAACRFCNEVHNRSRFDVEGQTSEQIVAMKKQAVLARRADHEEFWQEEVARD